MTKSELRDFITTRSLKYGQKLDWNKLNRIIFDLICIIAIIILPCFLLDIIGIEHIIRTLEAGGGTWMLEMDMVFCEQ